VELPLVVRGLQALAGLQCTLRLEPTRLSVEGVLLGPAPGGGWEVNHNVVNGDRLSLLIHAGPSARSLTPGGSAVVAIVRLRLRAEGCASDWVEFLGTNKAVDNQGTELPIALARNSEQATATVPVQAGWQLLSLPMEPAGITVGETFSASGEPLLTYGWEGSRYVLNPPAQRGQSFWCFSPRPATVTVRGRQDAAEPPAQIALHRGWNLIGNPHRDHPARWRDCFLWVGDERKPFRDATEWIVPLAHAWDPETRRYQTDQSGEGVAEPWTGWWILAKTDCSLEVPASRVDSGGAPGRTPDTVTGATFTVEATTGTGKDVLALGWTGDTTDGFDGAQIECPKPPSAPSGVSLSAVRTDWQANGTSCYSADLRRAGIAQQTWTVLVLNNAAESVTLAWGDLSRVPRSVSLRLVDPVSGATTNMRTTTGLSVACANGESRQFRLIAEPRGLGGQLLSQVRLRPGRGRVPGVSLLLGEPATVSASVRTTTGRLAGSVPPSRRSAGLNVLNLAAPALPRGQYLVEVIARADDGRAQRAVVAYAVR